MRKLDNYGTFFVGGLGIGGAVGLASFAMTLDALLAFRTFIFIFAVSMAVAVVLTVVAQDEIREVEQDLVKNNVFRDRLALVSKAKTMGLTGSSSFERAENDVSAALSEHYNRLPGLDEVANSN